MYPQGAILGLRVNAGHSYRTYWTPLSQDIKTADTAPNYG